MHMLCIFIYTYLYTNINIYILYILYICIYIHIYRYIHIYFTRFHLHLCVTAMHCRQKIRNILAGREAISERLKTESFLEAEQFCSRKEKESNNIFLQKVN